MSHLLIANSKAQQPLDQHLFAIATLSAHIIHKLVKREDLARAAYLAGCWHDMGKIDPLFQDYLRSKSGKKNKQTSLPDEHPMHNEISFILFHLMNQDKLPNRFLLKNVRHSVFWHHGKKRREEDLTPDLIWQNLALSLTQRTDNISMQDIYHSVATVIESINELAFQYQGEGMIQMLMQPHSVIDEEVLESEKRPAYKVYKDKKVNILKEFNKQVQDNTRNNLIRTALVTADRCISGLEAKILETHIENKSLHTLLDGKLSHQSTLSDAIQSCLQGFTERAPKSERNAEQAKAAKHLSEEGAEVSVLEGAAGCGKTKIALEWALRTGAQKIIWVCPRVQICEGLLKQLTSSDYLPDAKIEIYTGDNQYICQSGKTFKTSEKSEEGNEKAFSGDITLTTIDQITNSIITHKKVTALVDYMTSHVVFDEFHEYSTMPALNLMFAELVCCKKMQKEQANTLLVSATPNYFYLDAFLAIRKDDIVSVSSFNKHKFHIHLEPFDENTEDETHPLFRPQPQNTIVISNTASLAQKSFVDNHKNENGLLFHSKFIKPHKEAVFSQVMQCFGENSVRDYDILRSGPIVQASLNISCERMVSELTSPENMLQRMGRLDRFGLNTGDNLYLIAIPAQIASGKRTGLSVLFLQKLFILNSSIAWYHFIKKAVTAQAITLAELYQLYREFYQAPNCRNASEEDLIACLRAGIKRVTHSAVEPVRSKELADQKTHKIILKKYSLRGDSRYVQMAQCQITSRTNKGMHYLDEYICTNFIDGDNIEGKAAATLTLSLEEIMWDRGENNQSILRYMTDKDHLIFPQKYKSKYSRTKAALQAKARSPESPIYTSYTQKDLGQRKNHEEAIYYGFCDGKPVGAITVRRFYKKGKKNDD